MYLYLDIHIFKNQYIYLYINEYKYIYIYLYVCIKLCTSLNKLPEFFISLTW